jgi:hypothetical protein
VTPDAIRAAGSDAETVLAQIGLFVGGLSPPGCDGAECLAWLFRAAASLRSALGLRLDPTPLVEVIRAASNGPPPGWGEATAVEAVAVLGDTARLALLTLGVESAQVNEQLSHDPRSVTADLDPVIRSIRDPATYKRTGPELTPHTLEVLRGAIRREIARAVQQWVNAHPPIDAGYSCARTLAAEIGKPVEAVRTFLTRYARENPDCRNKAESRGRGEPTYTYRRTDVLPALRNHFRV